MDDIYKMELNEVQYFNDNNTLTRVPGGWIYIVYSHGGGVASSFVPFNNEFQEVSL